MTYHRAAVMGVILVGFFGSSCGPLGTPLTPVGRTCRTNADCRTAELCLKKWGECDGAGWCHERPTLIGASLGAPVCGCDGQTYGNFLLAESQGVNVAYSGACKKESGPVYRPDWRRSLE